MPRTAVVRPKHALCYVRTYESEWLRRCGDLAWSIATIPRGYGCVSVVRTYALRCRYLCDMIQYLITEMHVEVKCCYIFGLWREALPHSLS